MDSYLAELKLRNQEIVKELLNDGSDPDGLYVIEHHFSSQDFSVLENAAVQAFKAGYEVTDAEEFEDESGKRLFSFDIVLERGLTVSELDKDTELLLPLAEKWHVDYDGWGTYFIDPNAPEYDENDVEPE